MRSSIEKKKEEPNVKKKKLALSLNSLSHTHTQSRRSLASLSLGMILFVFFFLGGRQDGEKKQKRKPPANGEITEQQQQKKTRLQHNTRVFCRKVCACVCVTNRLCSSFVLLVLLVGACCLTTTQMCIGYIRERERGGRVSFKTRHSHSVLGYWTSRYCSTRLPPCKLVCCRSPNRMVARMTNQSITTVDIF